jgi:hypothetical protein
MHQLLFDGYGFILFTRIRDIVASNHGIMQEASGMI